jgi:hypothetical protein
MSLTGLFFVPRRVEGESHRLIHRIANRFLRGPMIQDWNIRPPHVLLFCASKLERELKHGTPATSVAGVYSFMGLGTARGR